MEIDIDEWLTKYLMKYFGSGGLAWCIISELTYAMPIEHHMKLTRAYYDAEFK